MATIRYYTEKYIQAIADAIRAKNGKTRTYKTREMGPAILEMVTYLTHLKQMSGWFLHALQDGFWTNPPSFSLDDEESGYAVFDGSGHYVLPALKSKHPRIYLKIHATNGAWQIYPVLYTDANGMAKNNSNIGVYPLTHSNNMPYTLDENYPDISSSYQGDNTNLSTAFENSIFSKAATYIWNVDTTGTHPAILNRLNDANSGVINFTNFSRDFSFTDLVGTPRRLDGLIENVIIYRNNRITNYPDDTAGTYFGVFFHTGTEKVYYDTSEGKLKSIGTMKSYIAPASYGSLSITDIVAFEGDTRVAMYYGKIDVSAVDTATAFDVTVSQTDVPDIIPFRTYDIKDQNGNTIAAKNCNVEDFGIEPKEE